MYIKNKITKTILILASIVSVALLSAVVYSTTTLSVSWNIAKDAMAEKDTNITITFSEDIGILYKMSDCNDYGSRLITVWNGYINELSDRISIIDSNGRIVKKTTSYNNTNTITINPHNNDLQPGKVFVSLRDNWYYKKNNNCVRGIDADTRFIVKGNIDGWTITDMIDTKSDLNGVAGAKFGASADGSTIAILYIRNDSSGVSVYNDTDGDGEFSDEVVKNIDVPQPLFAPSYIGGFGGSSLRTHINRMSDISVSSDGTKIILHGESGKIIVYENKKSTSIPNPPTNTAPTITNTIYYNDSNEITSTATEGDSITTSILFSEAISTPTIKAQTGASGTVTTFDIITSGSLSNGDCKSNTDNTGYTCQHTVTGTGLYKVYVTSYADTEGLAGASQTYDTNSTGVTVTARQITNYENKVTFTGSKPSSQSLTFDQSLVGTNALEYHTPSFKGSLIKTLQSGDITISANLDMNNGNTHILRYKDGSKPTSTTDGTIVSGGSPQWSDYYIKGNRVFVALQNWDTQNAPANRYYWIESSLDIEYSKTGKLDKC